MFQFEKLTFYIYEFYLRNGDHGQGTYHVYGNIISRIAVLFSRRARANHESDCAECGE